MDSCPAIAAPEKEVGFTTTVGKFYTIVEGKKEPMDIEELDRLHGQGLELVSEARVVEPRTYYTLTNRRIKATWRYIFRNQRQRNTMGPL